MSESHTRADSAQILLVNNAEIDLAPVLQVMSEFPELVFFPATPIDKTTFKTIAITADPVAAFRAANTGRATTRPTIVNKTVTCKFLDGSWDIDKLVVQECDRPEEETLGIYRAAALRGTFGSLCGQIWYGTGNDAGGFAGMDSLYPYIDSDNVVDAGGSTSVASAWLLHFDPQVAFALAWGKHAQLDIGDVQKVRCKDADGNYFWGLGQDMSGWCGLQLIDWESAVRVANIDSTHKLTDTLLHQALSKMRTSKQPDRIFMTRQTREWWRSGRTATNATGAPAPIPVDFEGIPVTVTESLSDTETALAASGT